MFDDNTELRAQRLPLTVGGLQTLFADIISEVVKCRLTGAEVGLGTVIEYAEDRMPAVFSREGKARGPGIAAIQRAIEQVETESPPERDITWPPHPQWLARNVDQVVTPLVSTFISEDIGIPGGMELYRRWAAELKPRVLVDEGEREGRTGFIRLLDSKQEAQYAIRRRGDQLHLGRRFRGVRTFEELGGIPVEAVPAIRALLEWFQSTMKPSF
jgi:hypothetical protein